MEKQDKKKLLENNKTVIITILCIIGIISIIGYTYSFFAAEVSNAVTIKGDAASPTVNLTISRVAPTEDKKLIPQLDDVIHKAVIGTQGNCLDDNNNAICQVYKITVTNTSTVATYINGKIELDAKDNPHLKWAQVSGLSNTTLVSDIKTHEDTILTSSELYEGGESKDYYVVVWISEIGIAQTDSGSFNGTVTFENIASNPALATLTRLGITPKNEILTTFTGISTDEDTGVYATEDDLGTSYYFRGNVTNNYVKFGKYTEDAWQVYDSSTGITTYATTCTAEGNISCTQIASANKDMYWRIVRINGDGTIRMIYDGTEAHANGTSSSDRQIGTSAFNVNKTDNAFVGYMNGTVDGTNFPNETINSISYNEAHTNTTNSTIKETIDNWYQKYIEEAGYNSYVADAIYCNNRKITTNQTLIDVMNEMAAAEGVTFPNTGFGMDLTYYGTSYDGLDVNAMLNEEKLIMTPTLKCPQENDRFTTEPTVGNVTGNDDLTYPVGLLTTDEVFFAGGHDTENTNYYLYIGNWYWTASPSDFDDGGGGVDYVNSDGDALNTGYVNNVHGGVRPVLSLNSTAITGGTGSITDPFTISS